MCSSDLGNTVEAVSVELFDDGPIRSERLEQKCPGEVGTGEIGTDMVTTVWNPVGFPFVIYGASVVGLPLFPCGCVLFPSLDVLVQTNQNTLSIPNNPSLFGVTILTQGMDFLAPQNCLGVPTALTDGYSFTIQ